MKKYCKPLVLHLVFAVATCVLMSTSSVQAQDEMPSATEVLKKFAEATGGADKYKAIKTLTMNGKMSIPAQGMNGTLKMQMMAPNKVLVNAEIPDVMTDAQGTDGEIAWSNNTMTGPRVLEGKEKDLIMEEASFERVYAPEKFYKEMKVVGKEDVAGQACYKLKMTKKNGLESTEYFSVDSGLQIKTEMVVPSQLGDMEIALSYSDYRETGGIKMAHKLERAFPNGMQLIIQFDEIKVNGDVKESAFAVPDGIKELMPAGGGDK